ncbi:hypothetical protein ABD76_01875 [Paenibacillus dendritiformis]|uniref:GNAT family N-acetyltransferase n=1 Tax=Paenibacillus dendritiformis TaxID=130049 RepID=UPI0018CCD5FE|nr:GNAT family N-acetyltransferase [Paenibacillus dendritiformis]MBG9791344.1 hypothetical protein [Paenibacillus dendritiformis]
MNQDGEHAFKRLDAQQLAAIRQLADLCNEHDGIILKLNWEMLQDRKDDAIIAFLYYAGGQVVGFLGLYQFRSSEVEVSGMVHPQYRRQGIFGKLVRAAQEECIRRNTGKLIFICERRSDSGRAYAESEGARYNFSEYWMQLGGWNEAAGAALEVAVENENALGLYTSCGFRIRNANDYYDLDLPAGKPRTE